MNEFVSSRSLLSSGPRFTIGRDQHGAWIVQDEMAKFGGIFASEEAALKFASQECKDKVRDIRRAPASATVELGLSSDETKFSSAA